MWLDFFAAALAAAVFLFLPGGLIVYSARRSFVESVGFGPILSVVFYSIAAVVYPRIGIEASWATLFVPFLLISLIVSALFFRLGKRGADKGLGKEELLYVLLYALVGVVIVGIFFVENLDGAGSFYQAYDNGSHLNTIRTFIETGVYSSFGGGLRPDLISPFDESGSSFYPSAWYCLVAMAVTATGAGITVAVNAVNFICASLIFPLSVLFAAKAIFGADKKTMIIGAALAVCAAPFPWGFLTFGPLYPNLLSMALFPAATACSVCFVRFGVSRNTRVVAFLAAGTAAVALLFAQPNAIFAELVVLMPFFVSECVLKAWGKDGSFGSKAVFALVVSSATMLVIWVALYSLPISMIRSVVEFNWPATVGKWQAFMDCLLYSFNTGAAQPLVALLVVVGAVKALSSRKTAWLAFSYAFACLIYFSSVSTEGFTKHLLSGFWYTDPYRLAATAAIVSLPLIVLGAKWTLDWITSLLTKHEKDTTLCLNSKVGVCAFALLFVVFLYGPSFSFAGCGSVDTGFGNIADKVKVQNSASVDNVLAPEERQFAEKALQMVPKDVEIVNEPNDGSGFLYALYDADNILYKWFALPSSGEEPESAVIRHSLDRVATDPEVKAAVNSFDAEYVLLLDRDGDPKKRIHLWSYYPDQWDGILRITDSTPGFEVVMAEGDMRLYKIAD